MIAPFHIEKQVCSECGIEKALTGFRHADNPIGRQPICRACSNAQSRSAADSDPELEAERTRKREYMRRRDALRRMKSEPISLYWRCDGIRSYGFEYIAEWEEFASLRVFKIRGNNQYYFTAVWENGTTYDSRLTELGSVSPKGAQQAACAYLEKERTRMVK